MSINLRELLEEMVRQNASDLYLTVDSPPMYRVEGVTFPWGERKYSPEETEEISMSLMSETQKRYFNRRWEMNLSISYPNLGRFRVNIFRQRGYLGLVFRHIKIYIKTIDELSLPQIFKELAMVKRGLVLVAGRTGSGKSTTLAALVDYRNSNATGHVVTVEDPIEFVHSHKMSIITQREVGIDTHGYASALKHTLRQAPDVILIGEIRDVETMEAAIDYAETGHLCFSTIHANNANQAIERVMNFFPSERHRQIYLQLSLNLKSIISQRLVPNMDGTRVAAVEILLDTPRVKDLIHKGQIDLLKETMAQGAVEGMQTFDQSLFDLYRQGIIDLDTAIGYADSANDLRLRIKMEEVGERKEARELNLRLSPDSHSRY
ncbi:MAG TPA: PilT/PilU family type 4a pilus ATPase [Thermodesulfobacteriota bacterium]|nr:PilT/PilU family type 4a pilus ATPase [Thermodesulfobacteriota bacterium]